MKIVSLFCVVLFVCGRAFALSQDWPCFEFEMKKVQTISENNQEFEYGYQGERKGYLLTVNLSGFADEKTSFADCGTTGCRGIITEIKTNKSEVVRLECYAIDNNYENVRCHISSADEFVFHKENGEYVVNYCSDAPQRTLRFKHSDCKGCHCKMFWYDDGKKDKTGNWDMGCRIEGDQSHCFTYNGYEEWRNFENKEQDFQNCIGLK